MMSASALQDIVHRREIEDTIDGKGLLDRPFQAGDFRPVPREPDTLFAGSHVLAEAWECDPKALDCPKTIEDALTASCTAMGATILNKTVHKFPGGGVTAVFALSESHISIHTWPCHGFAAIDVFTCGTASPTLGLHAIKALISARILTWTFYRRGIVDRKDLEHRTMDASWK